MPTKKAVNSKAGELYVTAQQSRFHVDATDNNSTEVEIKDLSISVGGKDLLSHAELVLNAVGGKFGIYVGSNIFGQGKHYVLVGRNGTGKSTLMKALAENRIPGVKWGLRILLLGQTTIVGDDQSDQLSNGQQTVVQHVIQSDRRRERALQEANDLSRGVENTYDPIAAVRAIRKVELERDQHRLFVANDIATRRSGARGKQSRLELIEMEKQVEQSKAAYEQVGSVTSPAEIQEATNAAVEALAEVQAFLELTNAEGADTKARSLLRGLGFKSTVVDSPFTSLSGGWRTRCELACALFQEADVLLLDECTNFLDLPAVIWLENYIKSLEKTTVVVITHDRAFADAVGERLIVLRDQTLEYFNGTVSVYERERYKKQRYLTKMKEAQDKKVHHIEESIKDNINAARRTGDDKKLKQAVSRKKKLEERTGMEVSAKGTRFKLNRDLPGYHTSNRAEIDIPQNDPTVKMAIPSEPTDLRHPGALLSMKDVAFAYFGTKKSAPLVLNGVDLIIHPGERVGIVGLNGAGKSTLVGLAFGETDAKPYRGTVERHSRAKFGKFSQHSVEDLMEKGVKDLELTSLGEIVAHGQGNISEIEARRILSAVGLPGKLASDVPVAALSGGQKVRLALAKVVVDPPHLLLLDEVTTHLDADTVIALVETLKNYKGAILLITHDRYFMRCVIEGEPATEKGDDSSDEDGSDDEEGSKPGVVYQLAKGKLDPLPGGMSQYENIISANSKKK